MRTDHPTRSPESEYGRAVLLGSLSFGNLSAWLDLRKANADELAEYVACHGREGEAAENYQRLLVTKKIIDEAIARLEQLDETGC